MTAHLRTLCTLLLAVLVTGSCTPRRPPVDGPTEPSRQAFPVADYQAASDGATIYRLLPHNSTVDILVRRGGTLARFGHDHVVSAVPDQAGAIIPAADGAWARADLHVELKHLEVDRQDARDRFRLDTTPSQQDIDKTRENMLGKVLEADQWPEARLHLRWKKTAGMVQTAQLTVALHGHSRQLSVPFSLQTTAQDNLLASGSFALRQSDFGITPFSILGGGLQVQDEVMLHFRVEAEPVLITN